MSRLILTACIYLLATFVAAQSVTPLNPLASFPPEQVARLRDIYEHGQTLGNRQAVFSKVGDSITVAPFFFRAIGEGRYRLGDYAPLQTLIDAYSTETLLTGNSFDNKSLAADVGWAAGHALDPRYANGQFCSHNEMPLVCEYRVNRPSLAFIMFGTNDVGYVRPSLFRFQLQRIVDISADMGVIPLLSTIPPQPDRPEKVEQFNAIIRDVAATNHLPVWDYYAALVMLPNGGLSADGLHPSAPEEGYAFTAQFYAPYLSYGYVVRNLTGLQMLAAVWEIMQS